MKAVTFLLIGFFMILPGQSVSATAPIGVSNLYVDIYSKKIVGEELSMEIVRFFKRMEMAVATENLEEIMSLYSENYINGPFVKKDMEKVWKRIFAKYDDMTIVHNISFVNTAEGDKVMIVRCSGMLLGVPIAEDDYIAIDDWIDCDHVIANSGKGWSLVGTAGKGGKRLGYDKPMQPLF